MDRLKKSSQVKYALLGGGIFARPVFELWSRHFLTVPPESAECLVVANYGRILTAGELQKPKYGAINLHPSLLPKYRGPTPIQTAIANGDEKTGVTVIKMDEQIDHGSIIAQNEYRLKKNETTESAMKKLGELGAQMLFEIIEDYIGGKKILRPQNHSRATFTKKVKTADLQFNCNDDPVLLFNSVRAYGKEPGVFLKLNAGLELKIISAKLVRGKFVPTLVQKPGKKKMSFEEFKRGYRQEINL